MCFSPVHLEPQIALQILFARCRCPASELQFHTLTGYVIPAPLLGLLLDTSGMCICQSSAIAMNTRSDPERTNKDTSQSQQASLHTCTAAQFCIRQGNYWQQERLAREGPRHIHLQSNQSLAENKGGLACNHKRWVGKRQSAESAHISIEEFKTKLM
jgi:hypothetical protein